MAKCPLLNSTSKDLMSALGACKRCSKAKSCRPPKQKTEDRHA